MMKKAILLLVFSTTMVAMCFADNNNLFQGIWVTAVYKKPQDLTGRTFMAIERLSPSRFFIVSYSTFHNAFSFAGYGDWESCGRIKVALVNGGIAYLYFNNASAPGENLTLIMDYLDDSYPYRRASELLK